MQEPWFRKQTNAWYVEIDGVQTRLGPHPADRPPVKGKRGWAPPPEIVEAWHVRMREGGLAPATKAINAARLFDEFLAFVDETGKAKTRDWYRFFLQDFKDRHPAIDAAAVDESHVERWLRAKRKRTWGQSTRRGAITALKRVMSWAVKTRRLTESPIAHMSRPAVVRRERILTAPERGDILALYPEGDPF
ncbi:hypothetical protein EP7_004050 [Isosphaeraceae bacterium EP7]